MSSPDRPHPAGDHADEFTPREALMQLLHGESAASKTIEALSDLADWRRVEAEIILVDEGLIEGSEDIETLRRNGDTLKAKMDEKSANEDWGERYNAAIESAYSNPNGIWSVYWRAAEGQIGRPEDGRMRPVTAQAFLAAATNLRNDLQFITGS